MSLHAPLLRTEVLNGLLPAELTVASGKKPGRRRLPKQAPRRLRRALSKDSSHHVAILPGLRMT